MRLGFGVSAGQGGELVVQVPSERATKDIGIERDPAYAKAAEKRIASVKPLEAPTSQDSERLQHWLESLDPDEMGKYKM